MPFLCELGWHRPDPMVRWNDGDYFARCGRCGRDLVRTAYGGWHVPKGYRVVWQARPPEGARPIHASAELRQSAVRTADPKMELPIQAVLRQLKERQQALAAAPEPDVAAAELEAHASEPEAAAPETEAVTPEAEPELVTPEPQAAATEPEPEAPQELDHEPAPAREPDPAIAEPSAAVPFESAEVELPEPVFTDEEPAEQFEEAVEEPDEPLEEPEESLEEPHSLVDSGDPLDEARDPLEQPLQDFAEAVEDHDGSAAADLPDDAPEAAADDPIESLAAAPEPFQAEESPAIDQGPAAVADPEPVYPPADDFMEEDPDRDVWAADPLDFSEPASGPPMPEPLPPLPAMAAPDAISAPDAIAAPPIPAAPVTPPPLGLPLPPQSPEPPPAIAGTGGTSPPPAEARALARAMPARKSGPVAVPRRTGSFPRRVALPLILSCGVLLLLVEMAGGAEDDIASGSPPLPPVTAPAAAQPTAAYVAARIMNCRSAPARQAGSVRKLARGEPVEIIAREGDWVSVSHRGRQCWAAARYLSTQQPL